MYVKHNNAYKRFKTQAHISRKKRIVKDCWGLSPDFIPNVLTQPHRLSKGKVHCSCPMCSQKTRKNGWKYRDKVNREKGLEENADCHGQDITKDSYIFDSNVLSDSIVYTTSVDKDIDWDVLLDICDADLQEKKFAENVN
mgnify:FL=1